VASKKRIVLQVLAYTLYGLGVFLVILYVTFPYDLVWQRLVDEFSQDDLQLSVTHIRPGFPLGVSLRNVRLRLDSLPPPGTVLQLQTLRLQPAWLPLLSRTLQINLDAALYNGRLRGAIHPPLPNTTAWTLQGRFAGLRLERHPLLQKEGEPFLRGRLDGGLDLTISQNGQIQPGTVSL
jgi:type II secretion system protein N